jgi:hypothetical protein
VTVLFFGRLKELTGHVEDSIESAEATTIPNSQNTARRLSLRATRNSPPGIRLSTAATKSRFCHP